MENSKKSCQWQEKLTEWYKAVKVVVSDIFYERHRWHVRRYQGRQAGKSSQAKLLQEGNEKTAAMCCIAAHLS